MKAIGPKSPIKVNFLYYPPKTSALSRLGGHAAVVIQHPDENGDYKRGKVQLLDFPNNNSSVSLLNTACDAKPELYPLPIPQNSNMDDSKITSQKYNLGSYNCAHASACFLKQLGYSLIDLRNILTPNDLKNQIIQHYSLSAKLAQIFDYLPQSEDKEYWDNLKQELKTLFKLDDENHLPKDSSYQDKYDWPEIRNQISQKIQPYAKASSESSRRLSEVLKIVELFCGSDQKKTISESTTKIYSTLFQISDELLNKMIERRDKYASKNKDSGKTYHKLKKTKKLITAMDASIQYIQYESTDKLLQSIIYLQRVKNEYKSIATAGIFGMTSVTNHDAAFIEALDNDIGKMYSQVISLKK